MKQRISIKDLQPNAYKAMMGFEKYMAETMLPKPHREMIKIRASQLNGCAYCIQLHTADARKLGETEQRIYALSAWRESPLFTDEERCLLQITEEVTLIANHGLTDATYQKAKQFFDDVRLSEIIMQVITINAWNRIAISTRMFHETASV